MAAAAEPPAARPLRGWLNRLIARPGFQAWAARFPLTRGLVRREGAALFDIVAGFVGSQALAAIVELRLPERLMDGPCAPGDLAPGAGLSPGRMALLLQAGAALGLFRRRRDGRYALAARGAALAGVPGLQAMIRHHGAFYRDMADPLALLRGEAETELAAFWPYVFGARGDVAPEVAHTYSQLMADSQALVAEDVLATLSLRGIRHLMDVGGGSGAFLQAVAARAPDMALTLFDLPVVMPQAQQRLARAGIGGRVALCPGSFRDDPLPRGADAISLVRVLYDHDDATVAALLRAAHDALPPGGRLIVAEPMAGGDRPERAGDVYYAFYTLAMRTGRARSAAEIGDLCRAAGFTGLRGTRARRPFVTSVLTARRTMADGRYKNNVSLS